MALQPVTPAELAALRLRLYRGDHQVDPATARRLMDEIERLRTELEEARVTFARKAAEALGRRLSDVATYNHGGCPTCRDGEARAFLVRLRRIAGADREAAPPRRPTIEERLRPVPDYSG